MKTTVIVNGEERHVEIGGGGQFQIDGLSGGAEIIAVGDGKYSVVIDGAQYAAHLEQDENGSYQVDIRGHSFQIEIVDPRRLVRGEEGFSSAGSQTITAPMPGKVVEIKVAPGDSVRTGDGVIVVEAMKMQNELKAARDGTVAAVNVSIGDSVAPGNALAVIEESPTMGQVKEARDGRQS